MGSRTMPSSSKASAVRGRDQVIVAAAGTAAKGKNKELVAVEAWKQQQTREVLDHALRQRVSQLQELVGGPSEDT